MDINRGILKALFYDYPVDALVHLLDSRDIQHDVFLDIMPQLMQWSKPEYTYTEANLLRLQTGAKWQNTLSHNSFPTIYHSMDVLKELTRQFLTMEKNQPTLKFDQLFRWKETALYVGEDLLTTAFVAQYDVDSYCTKRQLLPWHDIIRHNNRLLNLELDNGLTDLHAHFNATADVFSLNWISMMNNVKLRQQFANQLKRSQELELLSPQSCHPSTIQQHCVAAAYLRFVFSSKLLQQTAERDDQIEELIETNYEQKVIRILTDDFYADNFVPDLQAAISAALQSSTPTVDKRYVDYCLLPHLSSLIMESKLEQLDKSHEANYIYQGERQLLYAFFYGYYSQDPVCVCAAPYFYLYILLKNKIRREFVQINQIKGFENFETYQDRKSILLPKYSPITKFYPYYVVHTSLNSLQNDHIEVRITPKSLRTNMSYTKPMFSVLEEKVDMEECKKIPSSMSVVVHFIKEGKYATMPSQFDAIGKLKDGTRDKKYRKKIRKELGDVLSFEKMKKVVGIDAASREIFCRPEVFGHVFRYAHYKGIQGRTFHAGEDFLDLPDGLRAIDEAILFLQLDDKCRIGHAMALGIDAKAYYERRHYTTIITKQYLLDNCVWLYMRSKELNITLSPIVETTILENALRLYCEIGYKCEWNIQHYWQSMLLRGNDPEYIHLTKQHIMMNAWDNTANVYDNRVLEAVCNERAKELFSDYFYDENIYANGLQLEQYKWEKDIVTIMTDMQNAMRNMVSEKDIGIECCPTSNLKIGYIDKYENHPLLTKFYPIDAESNYPLIRCSINTDDRGVFYTSLYEEYSLIALALKKKRNETTHQREYNDQTIINYVAQLRNNAQVMAFKNNCYI